MSKHIHNETHRSNLKGPSNEIFCSVFFMNVFHLNLLLCTIRLLEYDLILEATFSIFGRLALSITKGSRDSPHHLLQGVAIPRIIYCGESKIELFSKNLFIEGNCDSAYRLLGGVATPRIIYRAEPLLIAGSRLVKLHMFPPDIKETMSPNNNHMCI